MAIALRMALHNRYSKIGGWLSHVTLSFFLLETDAPQHVHTKIGGWLFHAMLSFFFSKQMVHNRFTEIGSWLAPCDAVVSNVTFLGEEFGSIRRMNPCHFATLLR